MKQMNGIFLTCRKWTFHTSLTQWNDANHQIYHLRYYTLYQTSDLRSQGFKTLLYTVSQLRNKLQAQFETVLKIWWCHKTSQSEFVLNLSWDSETEDSAEIVAEILEFYNNRAWTRKPSRKNMFTQTEIKTYKKYSNDFFLFQWT